MLVFFTVVSSRARGIKPAVADLARHCPKTGWKRSWGSQGDREKSR